MWKDSWLWFYVKQFVGWCCVWTLAVVFLAACLALATVLALGF